MIETAEMRFATNPCQRYRRSSKRAVQLIRKGLRLLIEWLALVQDQSEAPSFDVLNKDQRDKIGENLKELRYHVPAGLNVNYFHHCVLCKKRSTYEELKENMYLFLDDTFDDLRNLSRGNWGLTSSVVDKCDCFRLQRDELERLERESEVVIDFWAKNAKSRNESS